MIDEKFKVVEDRSKVTAFKGSDKGAGGLDRDVADADAKRRNADAEKLGIKTRYSVVPMMDDAA